MPLTLVPTIDDLNIEELEKHLEIMRNKRVITAVQYQQSRNIKLNAEANKLEAQLQKQVDLLGKDLLRLDASYDKCKERLAKINMLKNELGFVVSTMVE